MKNVREVLEEKINRYHTLYENSINKVYLYQANAIKDVAEKLGYEVQEKTSLSGDVTYKVLEIFDFEIIQDWIVYGGVLDCYKKPAYPTYEYVLYVMEEGDFYDHYDNNRLEAPIGVGETEYGRLLCENAIELANIPEKTKQSLKNYLASIKRFY